MFKGSRSSEDLNAWIEAQRGRGRMSGVRTEPSGVHQLSDHNKLVSCVSWASIEQGRASLQEVQVAPQGGVEPAEAALFNAPKQVLLGPARII